jgi:hypothetical protein
VNATNRGAAGAALLGLLLLLPCPAQSAELDVPALVAACRDLRNGARLSADNDVLCFDGEIRWDTALSPFHALNRGGTLVVRSPGGLTVLAMQMADILREKSARVVIHDFCISACANALLVATHETHVADGALVAWHGNTYGCAAMPESTKQRANEAMRKSIARFEEVCQDFAPYEFYRKRGISSDFTLRPQTVHGRNMFHILQRRVRNTREIFWTWHPSNFRDYFNSKIVFGSVPDQATFEAKLQRIGTPTRVIYDPPGGGPSF